MIHHYTDTTHDSTGTYRSIPGAGSHPSRAWLAAHGWYHVAQLPPAPGPGMTWHPADPPYLLVDGLSVPQGDWRETPAPEPTPADVALAQYHALLADLGLDADSDADAIAARVEAIPDATARADTGLRLAALSIAVLNRGGNI